MDQKPMQAVVATTSTSVMVSDMQAIQLMLFNSDGTPRLIPNKAAAQADSTAIDIAGLKTDFNALLAKLRTAGLLASS